MGTVEIGFGIFFLAIGLLSLYGYITKNETMFWKRNYFIKFWGEKIGKILHFIGYVIVPIIVGLYFILTNI